MHREFRQFEWDFLLEDDCRQIVRLAVREDLDRDYDVTTVAMVPESAQGRAAIVFREEGIVAGIRALETAIDEMHAQLTLTSNAADGSHVEAGRTIAEIAGSTRDLLTTERTLLNLVGRLSGIATLTRQYVEAVRGTNARIYDTRKTTPAWRRLEKYAVHYGGGRNHRTGLFDAVLIKDNHLAAMAAEREPPSGDVTGVVAAVRQVRDFIARAGRSETAKSMLIEIEVDTLEQLEQVLPEGPDIVLLDNMNLGELRRAVELRNAGAPEVELEASGGVTLDKVAEIAETGIERISVGSLTRAARSLDVGLDWVR